MPFEDVDPNCAGPLWPKSNIWRRGVKPGQPIYTGEQGVNTKENVVPNEKGSIRTDKITKAQGFAQAKMTLSSSQNTASRLRDGPISRGHPPAPHGLATQNRVSASTLSVSRLDALIATNRKGDQSRYMSMNAGGISVSQSNANGTRYTPDAHRQSSQLGRHDSFAGALKTNIQAFETIDGTCSNYHVLPSVPRDVFACLQLHEEPRPSQGPSLTDYGRMLQDLSEDNCEDSAKRGEELVRKMITDFDKGISQVRPDGFCFHKVIHAYARLGMADAAGSVLLLMFQDYENGNHSAEPNVRVYTDVLKALRMTRSPEAPEQCEAILRQMHELHDSGKLASCQPDTFAYTVLFHCWSESKREDATARAQSLFHDMKSRFRAGQEALRPDTIAYSNLLNTFVEGGAESAAEALLWEMVEDYLSGNSNAKPRIRNFNTVLAMWSKSSQTAAPEYAESIVVRLKRLNDKDLIDVKPDAYTYSLLLKCWCSSSRPDGPTKAVGCLNWLRERYKTGKDDAARPDLVKYTTCISALARTGKPAKADDLLKCMLQDYQSGIEEARPDGKVFSTVINAWTGYPEFNTPVPVDGGRAEHILRQMWKMKDTGLLPHIQITSFTYTRIIICYKKTRQPRKAETLLWEMDRLYKEGKIDSAPNLRTFQTVLNGWNHSHLPEKHIRVNVLRSEIVERFHTFD